jgi:16S rRNA (cytosine967-C5)-methyltransferase
VTPAARIAATIELLTLIEDENRPADLIAASFWQNRRYMGSKDRKSISDRVWTILRHRARYSWWIEKFGLHATSRLYVITDFIMSEHLTLETIKAIFSGESHAPTSLSLIERQFAGELIGQDLYHRDMPDWVRSEYPSWLDETLKERFGEQLSVEMGVMRDEATVDLRVNSLKTNRSDVMKMMIETDFSPLETPLSPLGIRLPARLSLSSQSLFRDGLVEVQDEGSQLVALLTDAKPGQMVMDFCAGAGGKTLALAATMQNKGRLFACDIHGGRAAQAKLRLRRAGIHNVTRHVLEKTNDKWLKRHLKSFDRVLVDAPCSGSGTWRRNPDSKWRLTPDNLENLKKTQSDILVQAAKLVTRGGRLIYATCSLLPDENEEQISSFLLNHLEFELINIDQVWTEVLPTPCPQSGPYLKLTPYQHKTDGFFVAVMLRKG